MTSKYTYKNVAISAGGRSGLTRIAAALGNINLGNFLPDFTAYEELFEAFKYFLPIPMVIQVKNSFRPSASKLDEKVVARGLGAIIMSNPYNLTGHVVMGKDLDDFCQNCERSTVCSNLR